MTNNKKVRVLSPYTLLTYLMVITFVLTGLSFARFGETKTAEDAAKAATFSISCDKVQEDKSLELYIDDDIGTQVMANYTLQVTSTSEVPVTYDITLEAPAGNDIFPFGLEVFLTPVNTQAANYETVVANAKKGMKTGGTHVHRAQPTDGAGANPSRKFAFTGCGIAPAGENQVQEYIINFHYRTADDSWDHTSTKYSRSGMKFNHMKGIKVIVTAHDGRHMATHNNTTTDVTFTENYTK